MILPLKLFVRNCSYLQYSQKNFSVCWEKLKKSITSSNVITRTIQILTKKDRQHLLKVLMCSFFFKVLGGSLTRKGWKYLWLLRNHSLFNIFFYFGTVYAAELAMASSCYPLMFVFHILWLYRSRQTGSGVLPIKIGINSNHICKCSTNE